MEKKLVENSSTTKRKLVVDTSYLLPITGIRVKGLSIDLVECILENYETYYPAPMLAELEAVILREAGRRGLEYLPEDAIEGVNTIVHSQRIKIVLPEGKDLEVVHRLVKLGWKDLFNNILYATGVRLKAYILTLDNTFKQFLRNNKLEYRLLITHRQLDKCSY